MLLQLVMIIKNSEHCISNTILSIIDYIDCYTILDTGSTDNTIQIVKNLLKNKTGQLLQEPFIDFSTSRNRALDLSKKYESKYTIMLDDSYILKNGNKLLSMLKNNNNDSYHIAILDNKHRLYYSNRIQKQSKNLRYIYKVHEVIQDCDSEVITFDFSRPYIYDYRDSKDEERTKNRLLQDKDILEEENKKNPNDKRTLFFLGNTYFQLQEYDKAIRVYEKRACMSSDEEAYMCMYNVGTILNIQGRDSIIAFQKAYEIDSERAEPLYRLGLLYTKKGDINQAFSILEKAYDKQIPNKILNIEYDTYIENIPCLYGEVCLMLKKYDIAKRVFSKLLDSNVSNEVKHRVKVSLSSLEERKDVVIHEKRLIVFHAGDSLSFSGSEYMLLNIAKMLSIENTVYVFSKNNFLKNDDTINFRDSTKYEKFIQNNFINILIVSRFSQYLYYYENIEKVYLWLHDLIPQSECFQTHQNKFKSVICLSEYHKKFFINEYKFPVEWVSVINNAIDIKRFDKDVKKIKNRFIYTSEPRRGLFNAVNIFYKIQKRIPNSTFYIFANVSDIDEKTLFLCATNKNIFIEKRKNQDDIAIEFLKSDVWLYPTVWRETFCITALESQISKCLCVCYNVGALSEIVGNRGLLASNEDELIKKLLFTLENQEIKNKLLEKGYNWAKEQTFEKRILEWESLFKK